MTKAYDQKLRGKAEDFRRATKARDARYLTPA